MQKNLYSLQNNNADNGFFSAGTFFILVGVGIILNSFGLFNEILEPDGTLYATISKHIAQTNDWINLIGNGSDWLDKPHFPFWVTALSFKVFGYTAFAYKLPSFLFWLMAVYYTYQLALKLYSKKVAQLSVIIYITALHVILSNFDVRAEGYLSALIIAALYHIYCITQSKYTMHIVYAAIYCACAMMTKGIFVWVTIASGLIFYWIITKQWNEFFKPKWYLFLALSFVFILPELYCLYVQFDLHPEKIVFGKTNVSGIKFFFWDSQFGRFFNNGPIKGKGDLSFFFHTLLWAFLPWCLFLYAAVLRYFTKRKTDHPLRYIITVSALMTFLMFSLSKFQLPYYIVIVFPHFAMITANWLAEGDLSKKQKGIHVILVVLFCMLVALSLTIVILLNAANLILYCTLLCITGVLFFIKQKDLIINTAYKAVCFAFLLSCFLNICLYPTIMNYQAGMGAGRWYNQHLPLTQPVTLYRCVAQTSFTFYCNAPFNYADTINHSDINTAKPLILYGNKTEIDSLPSKGFKVDVLQRFDYFHISELTGKFISSTTRPFQLSTFEIVRVY
jgi:4-amino-4-deoxy-L-arabinose transferase-like glycosyltransferase